MARSIVGEIYLNVKPLDDGVSAGVQRIIDNASSKAAQVPVDADTTEASQAVAGLSAQIEDDLGGAWISATAQAAVFTGAVVGLKVAAEQALAKLGGIFDQLAQAEAGFTAILGSERAGEELLDNIREFARVSPFVTQELVNYSQQLLGVGQSAESIVPLLTSVGDVIASVGGDTQNISRVLFTLTQIRSIGRLVGQDAIQLQSSLIPITKLLADYLDTTSQQVKKLQEQGAISADTVFAAITAAGDDVSGAMATATRNIAGASSVLSDTIEIMLQDSDALRMIFDDVVAGILAFSTALGEPTIQNEFQSVSESIGRIYVSLQPLLEGLSSTASGAAISTLKILASTLEILAAALDAVPAGALELIGRGLVVMAALKAPLALLNYGRALRDIGNAVRPAALAGNLNKITNGITGSGDAAAVATVKIGRYNASLGTLATAFGAASLAGGLFVSSIADGSKELEALGSTLQGAGIGASLGAAFGPAGIAVGAAAGGGIAAITSFVTSAREEAQRRSEELKSIGSASAAAFLEGFDLSNPEGLESDKGFDSVLSQVAILEGNFNAADSAIGNLLDTQELLNQELLNMERALAGATDVAPFDANKYEALLELISDVEDQLGDLDGQRTIAQEGLNSLFTEGTVAEELGVLTSKLAALQKASPDYVEAVEEAFGAERQSDLAKYVDSMFGLDRGAAVLGQTVIASGDDLAAFKEDLDALGLSIDDVANLSVEELTSRFSDEIPTAFKQTQDALNTTKTAFDEAKKAVDEYYGGFNQQISLAKQATEESNKLAEAQAKVGEVGANVDAGLAFAQALQDSVNSITTANQAIFDDQAGAIASGLSFAKRQFQILRQETHLTGDEFERFLDTIGLLDLYLSTRDVETGFSGTIKQLSDDVGLTVDQVREFLKISEDIGDTDAVLTITADVVDALSGIQEYDRAVNANRDAVVLANGTIIESLSDLVDAGGAYRVVSQEITDAGDVIATALNDYIADVQAVQNALAQGTGLANVYEELQLTETGSTAFANTLIQNFQDISAAAAIAYNDQERALNSGLGFVATIFDNLQADLGLSNEAFVELIDSMGLLQLYNDSLGVESGFFGSIDDLIRETGLANTELQELLNLTQLLDDTTVITVTADVTQALEQLARLRDASPEFLGPLGGAAKRLLEKQIKDQVDAGGASRVLQSDVLEEGRKKAAEEARKLEEQRLRDAEQAAREAERAREEALREQERIADALESAGKTMESAMQNAANAIEAAADQWTASITERVTPERAVPIDRLLRNAQQQATDLETIGRGLQELEARGLSPTAIDALGIDNVADIRQVQRLLQAPGSSLAELSRLVEQRDNNAETIARRQQREETKSIIVEAILQAAAVLGTDLTREQAIQLSGQFSVDGLGGIDVPAGFLDRLLNSAEIVRS